MKKILAKRIFILPLLSQLLEGLSNKLIIDQAGKQKTNILQK